MDTTMITLYLQLAEHRVRAIALSHQLEALDNALHSLGVVIWNTDLQLNLLEIFGMVTAEPYRNRPLSALYRDLFDLHDESNDPLAAHQEAVSGRGVTMGFAAAGRHYACIVEPNRNELGEIIGTVGISIALESPSSLSP